MNDRLYRSRDERIIAGVAGGVAERFDVDPSLVRIVWVILAIVTGSAFFWLYIVMAIVVPEEPTSTDPWASWTAAAAPGAVPGWAPPGSTGTADADWGGTAAGSPAGPGAGRTAAFAAAGPPDASSGEPPAGSTSGAEGSDVTDVALPGEPAPAAASSAGRRRSVESLRSLESPARRRQDHPIPRLGPGPRRRPPVGTRRRPGDSAIDVAVAAASSGASS